VLWKSSSISAKRCDVTIEEQMDDFLKFFDYNVPDPEHFPKVFGYFVNLWKYERELNNVDKSS